jgi:hypothetical protein
MKLWTAYKRLGEDYHSRLFTVLASHVAQHRGVAIGLIASREDADFLARCGFVSAEFIEAKLDGEIGATVKLCAIERYLPAGDALIDNDVFLSEPLALNPHKAWALNYEPLRLYRPYDESEMAVVQKCWPQGQRTINAGLLYLPPDHFARYARQALELGRQIRCIGHTYEQAFFVRYCQENGLVLDAVFPHDVHSQKQVEAMYQASGIRHPFCYKGSLREQQRVIDLAMERGDPARVRHLLRRHWPAWAIMAEQPLFGPL